MSQRKRREGLNGSPTRAVMISALKAKDQRCETSDLQSESQLLRMHYTISGLQLETGVA